MNEENKPTGETPQDSSTAEKKPDPVTRQEIAVAILNSLLPEPPAGAAKKRNDLIRRFLQEGIDKYDVSKQYNILILHDEGQMIKSDADEIYTAAKSFSETYPLLLILYSTGGDIGSAYLIGKLCREYSKGKFIAVVPRQAKSAATLLCCAADEIHMGSLSELGPIDPQIGNLPALGLKDSVDHIADLVKQHPQASEMFAKYLHLSLKLIHLGYYERVAASAVQYAEKLLNTHVSILKTKPSKIANDLVYFYKDHGFVIDKSEATEIFGDKVIKVNTPEYDLANEIYQRLMWILRLADVEEHIFYFIGNLSSEPHFTKKVR